MQLFTEGKIDAFLGFPPQTLELRAKQIGHVVVNSALDRPWSHYFCCMVYTRREFARKYPVATKRALRAILKAADICALEPERAAGFLVDKGYTLNYSYALQTMQELPYGKWREYDPGGYGPLLRPAPARGRDAQKQPPEAHRPRHRLALPQRAEEGAEGIMGHTPTRTRETRWPNSWQAATPSERSHDSPTYTQRFMLRLNHTSSLKLQELVDRFAVPKAKIIRHLITQAKPEDFPKSWRTRTTKRRAPRVR
jgi:hypothetical protein